MISRFDRICLYATWKGIILALYNDISEVSTLVLAHANFAFGTLLIGSPDLAAYPAAPTETLRLINKSVCQSIYLLQVNLEWVHRDGQLWSKFFVKIEKGRNDLLCCFFADSLIVVVKVVAIVTQDTIFHVQGLPKLVANVTGVNVHVLVHEQSLNLP